MKLYVRKTTREVAMRSLTSLSVDTSIFDEVDYSPTALELARLERNWPAKYVNDVLILAQGLTDYDNELIVNRAALGATVANVGATTDERFAAVLSLIQSFYKPQ